MEIHQTDVILVIVITQHYSKPVQTFNAHQMVVKGTLYNARVWNGPPLEFYHLQWL